MINWLWIYVLYLQGLQIQKVSMEGGVLTHGFQVDFKEWCFLVRMSAVNTFWESEFMCRWHNGKKITDNTSLAMYLAFLVLVNAWNCQNMGIIFLWIICHGFKNVLF